MKSRRAPQGAGEGYATSTLNRYFVLTLISLLATTGGEERRGFQTLYRAELGVIMQPGRIISIADTDHVAQEFSLMIPKVLEMPKTGSIYGECAKKIRQQQEALNKTVLFEGTCETIKLIEDWLDAAIAKLLMARAQVVRELFSTIPHLNVNGTKRHRRGGLPLLEYVGEFSYYVFGTARADDVAKNEETIQVLKGGQRRLRQAMTVFTQIAEEAIADIYVKIDRAMTRQDQLYQQDAELRASHDRIVTTEYEFFGSV